MRKEAFMINDKKAWLKADFVNSVDSTDKVENLFALLKQTDYVKEEKLVQQDIYAWTQKNGSKINERLNIIHAATNGIKHLCAAVLIDEKNQIHAVIAYKKNSFCLKRLGGLLEVLIDLSDSQNDALFKRLREKSSLAEFIEVQLQKRDISIFDVEEADKLSEAKK